jgi:hypothetical protein
MVEVALDPWLLVTTTWTWQMSVAAVSPVPKDEPFWAHVVLRPL